MTEEYIKLIVLYLREHKEIINGKTYVEWNDIRDAFRFANDNYNITISDIQNKIQKDLAARIIKRLN